MKKRAAIYARVSTGDQHLETPRNTVSFLAMDIEKSNAHWVSEIGQIAEALLQRSFRS